MPGVHALPASSLLAAALHYATLGWPVVPLHTPRANGSCSCRHGGDCDHAGKHPRYHPHDLPNGLYAATTNAQLIRRWWRRWPTANIGIATGRISGLLVVDLDGSTRYRFPATATVTTGKGCHLYFRHPDHLVRNRIRLLPNLDLRAEHALVVAPPSRHASGQRYAWQPFAEPVPLPAWLLAHLRPPSQPPRANIKSGTIACIVSMSDCTRKPYPIRNS